MLFIVDFCESEKIFLVEPCHPWHPDYGMWVLNDLRDVIRYPIQLDSEGDGCTCMERWDRQAIYVVQNDRPVCYPDNGLYVMYTKARVV